MAGPHFFPSLDGLQRHWVQTTHSFTSEAARALVKQTVVKMVQERLWGQPRGKQADEGLEGRSWLVTVVLRTSGEFHSFIAFL